MNELLSGIIALAFSALLFLVSLSKRVWQRIWGMRPWWYPRGELNEILVRMMFIVFGLITLLLGLAIIVASILPA